MQPSNQWLEHACRTVRLVAAGRRRDEEPAAAAYVACVEKVLVHYHIACLHEYGHSVMLHIDYPDQPGEDVSKQWPVLPPYHPPSTYINEHVRRDLAALEVRAFRGETYMHLIENVHSWEEQHC